MIWMGSFISNPDGTNWNGWDEGSTSRIALLWHLSVPWSLHMSLIIHNASSHGLGSLHYDKLRVVALLLKAAGFHMKESANQKEVFQESQVKATKTSSDLALGVTMLLSQGQAQSQPKFKGRRLDKGVDTGMYGALWGHLWR